MSGSFLQSSIRKIAIIGGGTAGYLAALTLRRFHPALEITLIESAEIPVIGVGEATTSEIVPYLHEILEFEPLEFYRDVRPTWKLGIKFLWGPPNQSYFNYPFDRGALVDAAVYDGNTRRASLLSALMSADRSPVLEVNGLPVSLLSQVPFAYHLDNIRLIRYLKRKATERSIKLVDLKIADAALRPDGRSLEFLVAADGRKLQYDFYVDCTGFGSRLIGKAMNSPFKSYASSLFTDSALIATAPSAGVIEPYTTAKTMDSGWCWTTPLMEENHLGYVYSSAFSTAEQAEVELRTKYPDVGRLRTVKFVSGRREHFIKGNVAAVGNSYGFVEPLESTGIFVICRACLMLARGLTSLERDPSTGVRLNQTMGEIWDYLRWFLSVHYKFNSRLDTPFWKACRERVDVSGAAELLSQFATSGPLTDRGIEVGIGGGHNFDTYGYDLMLLGQAVPTVPLKPRRGRDQYARHVAEIQSAVDKAMDQETALGLFDNLKIADELRDPDGWIARAASALISGNGGSSTHTGAAHIGSHSGATNLRSHSGTVLGSHSGATVGII